MTYGVERYPWYDLVDDALIMQGDIIDNFEVFRGFDPENGEAIADRVNVIVMSQSCDIPKKATSHIVLCPVMNFDEIKNFWPDISHAKNKEHLRKGNITHLHLLNQCNLSDCRKPYMVVNFRRIFETPKTDLLEFVKDKKRLRLLPPYREHLAQAFARYFMRVGLPSNIPEFK